MSARYLLGLGGTVDYEVAWDDAVVTRLAADHRITTADLDANRPIETERDLLCSMLAFVRDGVGGERFVASSDVVTRFARHFDVRVTLGGTCVRAAIALDVVGLPATVHLVSIDDTVRRLLPASTSSLCSADEDTLDPHLIVQFPAGATVPVTDGTVAAPHPDRIIYVNDPPNRDLVVADAFGDACADADVVLVSGFNVMQDAGLLEARLKAVREHLHRAPRGAVRYFEDAGYHVPGFARRVRDLLADAVEVWAMNEHELQWWVGRDVDLLDPGDVGAALAELAAVVPAPVRVVHTRHWALAHGTDAARFRAALAGGVATAGTRYRLGDGYDARDLTATRGMALSPRGVDVARRLESGTADTVCVPAFDLRPDRPTTIGLGDTFVGGFLAALDGAVPAREDGR
jgi:ADP-dependent phosphofructokinase/glucokinase